MIGRDPELGRHHGRRGLAAVPTDHDGTNQRADRSR
jgi:hypothetical protein